ncbi:polysaccharide biosynthesis protein CapD [Richelia sinica FACHB-800]|uniref:Polysaccharide biosynthesis protein CapD n=1 Tax=Richelia sinica FACHB-800 TaxID=1357546 RepID=A0A975T3I6_9NOST|nr:nucleoside-diphosphate sugar epimerase/dehydratase [Richelia sinica]MBD2665310.1 polysaccharide biosynthesis protein [Richelia sinica FACHB-800]QXE21415.1 polysaccharide biosynthesis protein CapD [Richelia sinica FACHB-800]
MEHLIFQNHQFLQKYFNSLYQNFLNLRNKYLIIFDCAIFAITPLFALLLSLDGQTRLETYISELGKITIFFLIVKITILYKLRFYKLYWRYASIEELINIILSMGIILVVQMLIFYNCDLLPFSNIAELPPSFPLIDGLFSCILVSGVRFSIRILDRISQNYTVSTLQERVLIVGAGNAGISLVEEMQRNPQLGFNPIAFIDDDPQKLHVKIRGIPVVGDHYTIPESVQSLQIHKVIIAMPSVAGTVIREIVDICKAKGIQTSTLPGIHEILNGRVRVDSIRDVRIEDLLRREPIQTDIERVLQFLKGKVVLITGAGGSIGSELCRQICKCRPAQMILIGHGENSVFNIQQELEQLIKILQEDSKDQLHTPEIYTFIGDIRCRDRLKQAFEKCRPDVIFHAAAHKHVPLMELNSSEAITNNVLGTKNLLDMALQYNVQHFVMISTDKAVKPTNVMGASKRVAEMLVLQAARQSGKPYLAVRFGNVLGSRGSVVPTFKKQIAAGGPVTVTHPDICRYFMTIPEAVQLVLQAVVLGRSGEVLMLNMGKPVKIVDLAEELIRLSGYEVDKDIEIIFTGLRPGEKLFEELFIEGEEYNPTEHEKLFVVKNASCIIPEDLNINVVALCQAAAINDANYISFLLKKIVIGYQPKSLDNSNLLPLTKNDDYIKKSAENGLAKLGLQNA